MRANQRLRGETTGRWIARVVALIDRKAHHKLASKRRESPIQIGWCGWGGGIRAPFDSLNAAPLQFALLFQGAPTDLFNSDEYDLYSIRP